MTSDARLTAASDRIEAAWRAFKDYCNLYGNLPIRQESIEVALAAADRASLAQAGELAQWCRNFGTGYRMPEIAATLTAQAAHIAELEAALRPFAALDAATCYGAHAAEIANARFALGDKP